MKSAIKFVLKLITHVLIFLLLTAITQVGGIVYLISVLLISGKVSKKYLKRLGMFLVIYLLTTFLLVPNLAPLFGREKIKETAHIEAHSFFYKLTNRNYVRPQLNEILQEVSIELSEHHYYGIKLIYLDANFPFVNGFPLLPHLSHNDGKKIDITFLYETPSGKVTNRKPSVSGYGVFENPKSNEFNQSKLCLEKGNWQYDFTKYVSLAHINKELQFSNKGTKDLIRQILKQGEVGKVFIEPHLKTRMNLKNSKIRFHGCQAVRHDDHIHFQLK